jgi:hypothetical protein
MKKEPLTEKYRITALPQAYHSSSSTPTEMSVEGDSIFAFHSVPSL